MTEGECSIDAITTFHFSGYEHLHAQRKYSLNRVKVHAISKMLGRTRKYYTDSYHELAVI